MILRLTVCGLVILLIIVISLSYLSNKEGFETLTNSKNNVMKDLLNVSRDRYQINRDKNILKDELKSKADKDVIKNQLAKLRDDVKQLDADKKLLDQDKSSTPERVDVVPEITLSESGYNAMNLQQKINLLKDIQKVVKSDLIVNRNLLQQINLQNQDGSHTYDSDDNGSDNSISTMQGKEYTNGCLKPKEDDCYQDTEYRCPKNPDGSCPPLPDMTKYIKKDSIPCWGCSIDY